MHSKNLSRGCSLYLPVFVPGANLSMGDMHFSQGDGEVSFCGAIEMSGFLELKVSVIKGGMKMLPAVGPSPLSVNPIFEVQSSHLPLTLATYRPANQTLLPPSDNVTAFVARLAQTSESAAHARIRHTTAPAVSASARQPSAHIPRQIGPLEPRYSEFLVFEGISVDEQVGATPLLPIPREDAPFRST